MSLLKIEDIRRRARAHLSKWEYLKSASMLLEEANAKQRDENKIHDVFLSHSFKDAELILGVKLRLESYGHSVYVDWIDDPQMDRARVDKLTVARLREKMNSCKSLCYVATPSSSVSKWMPWECGYMDGKKNRVAILPLAESEQGSFVGQEYLEAYPYIDEASPRNETEACLWVNESATRYCQFRPWLEGENLVEHA